MSEDNQTQFELGATKLSEPHRCSSACGWSWISASYAVFKQMPGLWLLLLLMMMVAHRCYMESNAEFDDLFSGFRYRLWPLIQLSLLYIGAIITTLFVAVLLGVVLLGAEAVTAMSQITATNINSMEPDIWLKILIVLLIVLTLMLPVIMMEYFAPALIMFHEVDAFTAMKLSFMACWKNAMPFLVYGLLVVVLIMLTVFTLFLGLLILIPLMWIAKYIAYRDIFLTEAQELAA